MTAQTVETGVGRVARVTGPVVDVEFPVEAMPDIYNALQIEVTLGGETKVLTLEVAQHLVTTSSAPSPCSPPTA